LKHCFEVIQAIGIFYIIKNLLYWRFNNRCLVLYIFT